MLQPMTCAGGMADDDPNRVLLELDKTDEMIWTFNGYAEGELFCNVPGHRQSGMIGPVRIVDGHS